MAGILFFALAVAVCPFPTALLGAVAVHEAGHIISGLVFGLGLPSFSFGISGPRLSYHKALSMPGSLAVSLSGSLFGLFAAFVFCEGSAFRLYSLGFSLVNLLPVSSLDGGCALLCTLETFMLPDRAYEVSKLVSAVTVVALWAVSAAVQLKAGTNLSLLVLSVYLTVLTFSDRS